MFAQQGSGTNENSFQYKYSGSSGQGEARTDRSHDFGRDIIPQLIRTQRASVCPFQDSDRKWLYNKR
jgi:hypothetical protein